MHAHLLALTVTARQFKQLLWIWLPYENVHCADQLHTVVYIFCLYISLKTANDYEHEKNKMSLECFTSHLEISDIVYPLSCF